MTASEFPSRWEDLGRNTSLLEIDPDKSATIAPRQYYFYYFKSESCDYYGPYFFAGKPTERELTRLLSSLNAWEGIRQDGETGPGYQDSLLSIEAEGWVEFR